MDRVLAVAVLGGTTLVSSAILFQSPVPANAQQFAAPKATAGAEQDLATLPPVPKGRSTILGGEIRNVDPVMDRFTLMIYGQKPMKILFDERTQVFRDGAKLPLRELAACDHASVQTTLDGTRVFAISIHMLSTSPEGDYQGKVVSYNPSTGQLTLAGGPGGGRFKLLVQKDTAFSREGQAALSPSQPGVLDLAAGTLLSAKFESGKPGQGVATHITILATPGSVFVFSGEVSSLDMHVGTLVLTDPRDQKTYRISFDAARTPESEALRVGQHVRVSTEYDGTRYAATRISSY